MKIFGRSPARFVLGLKNLPRFLVACGRAFSVFRDPLSVIGCYLAGRPPADRRVYLHDGHVILLSADPLDIVTVFLIFARRDYGEVARGSTVVDIGGNIGVYALFAGLAGARVVYVYEPSAASYECLVANVRANKLENVIKPERRAVVGTPRATVRFPRHSSAMNHIVSDSDDRDDYDVVPTITLAEIAPGERVDLLKIDCEGGEYDIFLAGAAEAIRRIDEVRMECHRGPREDLVARLTALGFALRQFTDEGAGTGYLRLVRAS
jgi:FkbM family methyltransferase